MEKTTSLAANLTPGNLFADFFKKRGTLLNKIVPGFTQNKIEAMLFKPSKRDARALRLPRGFTDSVLDSPDGKLHLYQTGKGPTVVLVHGWDGGAYQFFPIMRGLAQCGFCAVGFDHLGHGRSEFKPATLRQSIETTNHVLAHIRRNPNEGIASVVGHSTGCIAIANARPALLKNAGLFMISPVFNYKLFVLKKLVGLELPNELVKQYANRFARDYNSQYQSLELARNLEKYSDSAVIAHDENDRVSSIEDTLRFVGRYPLTKLLVTRAHDHTRLINSESVWQELKSHLNYDDTTINFSAQIIYQ